MNQLRKPLGLIMLIDDDETTNFVNTRLLTNMKVASNIISFRNGNDAISYLKIALGPDGGHDYTRPDLIFLDIKMPEMDGFAFLDEYQNAKFDQQEQIVIMMLTSSASFYDLERLKNYEQVKKHISKALTEAEVRSIMREYFDRH